MLSVVKRNNLTIANASNKCSGTVTRHRVTKDKEEKSVLDYIIFCEILEPFFDAMLIDEAQNHILTKYATTKGAIKHIKSDHNIIYASFCLQYNKKNPKIKKEFFNFKNIEDQEKFFKLTSETRKLSNCFKNNSSFEMKSNKFFKTLDDVFHSCFKKIRIKSKSTKINSSEIQASMDSISLLKMTIKSTNCPEQKRKFQDKLKEEEEKVTKIMADKNAQLVKEHLLELDTIDGNFNQMKIWKLKNKLLPRPNDPPMAKKDKGGNLITAPLSLKKLYLETYRERLSERPMKAEYQDIYNLKNELWKLRYEELKSIKSAPWTLANLNRAIKGLKTNQSGDPSGIISELFKPGVLGQDLAQGLLMLCNGMKSEHYIPALVKLANITTIYKNKGSRLDLANDRGIFILSIFRKITDKMIYHDKYDVIDEFMSDSNIGARRKKNIRNHLFVIYAIINSVVQGKSKCIDIQTYDLVQAFDSLWLEDCLNDVYDALDEDSKDDKIALLYDINKENKVAVNTGIGQTDRIDVERIVTQGGTWGSLLCSNHIDAFGRNCRNTGSNTYSYKNQVMVLPLAMVDDLLGVANCGLDSLNLNTFINTQVELKKLRFHTVDKNGKSKCSVMHVGKRSAICPQLEVHGTPIHTVANTKYLGDIVAADSKNDLNIQSRVAKGMGNITRVMNMLDKVTLGKHYFKTAILLRESIFLSALLTNSESWHGVTSANINQLEQVDKLLVRKILKTPISTPSEAMYLELGILKIGTIIKARRINFCTIYLIGVKKKLLAKFLEYNRANQTKMTGYCWYRRI